MERKWQILFCDEMARACPITDFINQCTPKNQVKVLRILSLLEEHGPTLPRPYADTLHDGIHELRFTLSRERVRVLYFFCYRKFIVLYYVFLKNTRKVPEKFIRKVIEYRENFLDRIPFQTLEKAGRAVSETDL
ncbi:type II toxin-antitoxin system RelE/ParE family toxin [Desulfospira joergensenii]|uniref:type II toxin-antitoxin system RelE/ParE family toxin n=1 Tax=Desulfospira joergensenii TaxID=53329 RepID=UPI0003F76022|nr:type II toxin-antitoxin system RelE/ParE family toxin [Desulfospira joergensenii]